ncbi:MAG: biotin--[acetyl-CoA-carboxylase] ligase [Actinobacteria bacterium]|nr:biotin--[acetyl-CoA-carboxylase] ligase [Actinomycetota bacterium]MSW22469.1 biotin--[acetyl-CoA-carboxylase] ligase [Actinomycetota bacterium]MSX03942.1 biotin--[acetyl-CoA-carboxylase] ligase [Actinomycetota bacterium]MSX61060.1 biotin--[acetyl-CoA-carboxylase] ligase [Actinomycetota bacterium]MSX84098.1 biotin--[acetyl-CoA-carboxylase] ligase [Actinomycetota bacterium]
MPELMNANAIAGALASGYWRVSVIDEIDSTQNYLRISNPKPGDLITAEYQSAGRGRLDRKFDATKSSALLFSFYIEPAIAIKDLGFLSLLVGASVTNTLNEMTKSESFKCKWPNDIVFGDRKIAGLLAEKFGSGVIVGVGINVSTSGEQLPVPRASSIFLATGTGLDRNLLLVKILKDLESALKGWESGKDLTSAYRKLSATLGREVRVELPGGSIVEAIARDIDSTGALHLDNGQIITVGDVIHLDSKLSE